MPKRTRSASQQLKFGERPLRGFVIHLAVFVVVIAGLAVINLTRNPAHPWFLWVLIAWGIALALHDVLLLVKSRPKETPVRPSTPGRT
jgi:2TM domain